ncbi:hypothetical protein SAMN05428944_7475 [Streptomyces sp. 1222.5]|uniref:hypothetical protein n=1 Tax=unclassified Streptomyces TaxID=2593676 RepID=UPI00089D9B3C|nr:MULTISPECIES: hypothetical protein [unclassified Streptomyces]PKW05500.1 hypothetical protein BX260_0616 [Streptomyces sp. 5112.2]SED37537.1 hypothetical protein SAMN05428944_7475 [Streptomyces sp. 1222.5]
MTYRRAVIPALVGGLLITLLLWWAGASTRALQLPGTGTVFDAQSASELRRWLAPWAYPSRGMPLSGGSTETTWTASTQYADLYRTAMQIRYVAVFAFFLAGALLLLRRIPPTRGRTPATLLALWAWGPVAGTLAVTVSAPWLIASMGRGSFRVLPQLASVTASSGPVVVFAALVASVLTVAVARVTAKGTDPVPRQSAPPRAARLAASAGTAVIAFSLVILSYESVAARIQTSAGGSGLLSEPGDLLRQWLLLGGWTGPSTTPLGHWLLYRAADVVMLAVVWWALRLLPGLLTRTTVPAMAVGAVCATVLGLLASQLLHMAMDDTVTVWGPVYLFSKLGENVPAALTFGGAAGLVAFGVLRLAGGAPLVAAGHPGGETRTVAEDVHR